MTWVVNNGGLILERTLDHLLLALPSIVLAFVLSVPVGWLAHRYALTRPVLLTVSGLLYAIPSLPLFIILPAVLGTGVRSSLNVIAALTIYGMALMVRSASDAFGSVDEAVTGASTGVGFSAWQRFWSVQFPLAGPVLLAGVRVVAVSTISLVTVSAILGVDSLGSLFTDGFQRGIIAEVLAGIVMTVGLALLIDGLLILLGRVLLPWASAGSRKVKVGA